MLANISTLVARGVIDNTAQNLIDLRLWCTDGLEPLHLRLKGDCLRDIAGCRVEFTNKEAMPDAPIPDIIQKMRYRTHILTTGDMTLSRRVPEKNNRCGLCNILSLEFFVDVGFRFLIESADFDYQISLPQWQQSWEGDNAQQMVNMEALREHVLLNVKNYRGAGLERLGKDLPPCDWDYRLNQAEAYMAIYPSIHEKYGYEPGGYLSAAYVLNRTDFLGKEAAEEEAHMPPDANTLNRDWDVTDFLGKREAKAVRAALRHPLFIATARMTDIAQKFLIEGESRHVNHKTASNFINQYASIVTQLLATILLTREEGFSLPLAITRMKTISQRMEQLCQGLSSLPTPAKGILQQEAARLTGQMKEFLTSLSQ